MWSQLLPSGDARPDGASIPFKSNFFILEVRKAKEKHYISQIFLQLRNLRNLIILKILLCTELCPLPLNLYVEVLSPMV